MSKIEDSHKEYYVNKEYCQKYYGNEYYDIDTYNYEDYYCKHFGKTEERYLTYEELRVLYTMCMTANIHFVLGFCPCSCSYGIHKTPENNWVVSYCGERRDGSIEGIFDSIYEACLLLIHKCAKKEEIDKAIDRFNNNLNDKISIEVLEQFAFDCDYQDELFYRDFVYEIKKMSNIEVEENNEIEKRIAARKEVDANYDFEVEIEYFIDNIGKKLKINTQDLYDAWYHNKIDVFTYRKLKYERINLKEHQDIVLKELEKYLHLTNDKNALPYVIKKEW